MLIHIHSMHWVFHGCMVYTRCSHTNEGNSTFQLSSDPSTFSDKFEDVLGNGFGTHDVNVVEGVPLAPNLHTDEVFANDNDDEYFSMCHGYSREQWISLDVVLLNDHESHVTNWIYINTNPKIHPRKGLHKYDFGRVPCKLMQHRQKQILEDESSSNGGLLWEEVLQLFPNDKMKSLRQEMWFADFWMWLAMKL